MLTATTALAHSAADAAPAFNSTFYATAAVLIPVLFLAIAVQGKAFEQVISAPRRIAAAAVVILRRDIDQVKAARQDGGHWKAKDIQTVYTVLLKFYAVLIAGVLLELAAILIMAAGAIGELLAVYALYQGHDQPGFRLTVLLSAALLICAVIIEPVQAQVSSIRAFSPRGPDDIDLAGQQGNGGTPAAGTTMPPAPGPGTGPGDAAPS